jgi:4'-phosphopantetheinyl transferase
VAEALRRSFAAAFDRGLPAALAPAHAIVGFATVGDWTPWLDQAGRMLDAAERARVARMRRSADAAARTLAYALHRLFLSTLMDVDAGEVPIARDDRGRPVLACGWRTSLSHAEGGFAFAALHGGAVGIDLERVDRMDGLGDIESEICHPRESAALDVAPRDARARALLEAWARKEAYLKASGVGLAHPMASFVLPDAGVLALAGAGSAEVVETGMLALHPGYVAALARPPGRPVHAGVLRPG